MVTRSAPFDKILARADVGSCDGGITATVEKHVVQWNLVVLILSWRREEAEREDG
jgi:hypothetical protein